MRGALGKKRPPQYPSVLRQVVGVVSVPVVLFAIDVLAYYGFRTSSSGLIVLVLLAFVSCWSGLRAGLIAAFSIGVYYVVAYNVPASAIYHAADFERKLIGIMIVFPTTALIAGLVQNKLRASAAQAYDARLLAEQESEERARAQSDLLDSEQLRRIVVDSAMDAVIAIDANGVITLWNPSAERMFGWTSEEMVGEKLSEAIVPERYRSSHEHGLAVFRETGQGAILGQRLELSAVDKQGKEFDVELTVVKHDSAQGAVFVGFVRDVSLQKRMRQELLNSQKLESVGQLAGGVAHDFNNVLSVIVGFGELATKKLPANHMVQEDLREILIAAQRCFDINSQLLAFARKQYVEPRVVSLNSVIEGIVPMLRTLIKESVELTTNLSPELSPVLADPGQIEQLLTNLAINARDAMPHGGKLMIETRNITFEQGEGTPVADLQPGDYATISVTDTGSGIPSEHLDRIFEPFFTTKQDKGSGLGLAGAYGIVKNAGGRITVYSELGHGTMFRIYLPVVKGATESGDRVVERTTAERGSETVLVAEDNAQVRAVIEQTLRHYGYSVLSAKSGADAMELANHHRGEIHLLVTDLIMPKMGGTELAEELRKSRPETKVIFLSGYTEESVTSSGVDGVAGAFLQKPVLPTDLAAAVRRILDSANVSAGSSSAPPAE